MSGNKNNFLCPPTVLWKYFRSSLCSDFKEEITAKWIIKYLNWFQQSHPYSGKFSKCVLSLHWDVFIKMKKLMKCLLIRSIIHPLAFPTFKIVTKRAQWRSNCHFALYHHANHRQWIAEAWPAYYAQALMEPFWRVF